MIVNNAVVCLVRRVQGWIILQSAININRTFLQARIGMLSEARDTLYTLANGKGV